MIGNSKQPKISRKRGVVLTPTGLKRLLCAIGEVELAENKGEHLTLEELGDRTKVSAKTLSRLWSLNVGVDRRTLQLCFSTFNLKLSQQDYTVIDDGSPQIENDPWNSERALLSPPLNGVYKGWDKCGQPRVRRPQPLDLSSDAPADERRLTAPRANIIKQAQASQGQCEREYFGPYPNGPVPLNSPLYIERPPLEALAYQEILQPGCVIRIRAPKEMGKSSLVLRLLAFTDKRGYRKVTFNCNQIDSSYLDDLNKLLRCLCRQIAQGLGSNFNLDDYWDGEIGCKLSCSFYLHHLLKQSQDPVVLVLDEVDRFFEHPHIAQEFFALLRSWYEEARQDLNWQKLRLVAVYSTEEYVNLDINRSPFNIGLPVRLDELSRQQVEELVRRHGLNLNEGQVTQLMSLVGGHPALIRIALYGLCYQGMILEDLVREALTDGGVYRYHLWRHWLTLQGNPNLAQLLADLLKIDYCLSLPLLEAYKLESMGLIDYNSNYFKLRCELYRTYFKKQFSL